MKNVVILPTYNEKENIKVLIENIFKEVPKISVMVVDDNSPDGTSHAVEEMMPSYPRLSLMKRAGKEGLGKAYIDAFKKCLNDKDINAVCMMDADLSHDPKYLRDMVREITKSDVAVGSRYMAGGGTVGWELWRRILSRGGNLYCRLISRMPIYDCTGGFNLIRTSVLRKINFDKMDMSGYAFIMELKYSLFKSGAVFKEIPIIFKNRVGGESKISNHIIGEGILAPWKLILKK